MAEQKDIKRVRELAKRAAEKAASLGSIFKIKSKEKQK